MKEAETNFENFQSFLGSGENWHIYARELSEKGDKRLEVQIGQANYRVMVNDKRVWWGVQPYNAVEAYNRAFERYANPNHPTNITPTAVSKENTDFQELT